MKTEQILAEIQEANHSFLLLAQCLLRADRNSARAQLGLSEHAAGLLEALSPAQVMKLSRGNTLLCRAEISDDIVFGLLTSHGRRASNDTYAAMAAELLKAA